VPNRGGGEDLERISKVFFFLRAGGPWEPLEAFKRTQERPKGDLREGQRGGQGAPKGAQGGLRRPTGAQGGARGGPGRLHELKSLKHNMFFSLLLRGPGGDADGAARRSRAQSGATVRRRRGP